MKKFANAKINLALDVKRKNDSGYHDLDMIMAPVSLADTVEIEPSDGFQSQVFFNGKPADFENTLSKALEVFKKETGSQKKWNIYVEKNIPEQAGLAGGSADAAALLHLLNEAEGAGLDLDALCALGVQVGADVPFCLHNKFARVQGIGEKVQPLNSDWQFDLLLVKPETGISTPACFVCWDEQPEKHYDVDIVQDAITAQNMDLLYQTMENGLEAPAFILEPELEELKEKMMDAGLVRVMMTGSGSALMGFSVDRQVLEQAKEALGSEYSFCEIVTAGKPGE